MKDETQPSISVRLNLLGWPIKFDQIDGVLNPKTSDNKEALKWIEHFFGIDRKYLHHDLLERYSKACSQMKGILVGSVDSTIYNKLICGLVSAKKCYSFNETIACVEMCALYAEMLCIFLCIANQEHLVSDNVKILVKKSNKKLYNKLKNENNPQTVFDTIQQHQRIEWLTIARLLTDEEVAWLNDVHNTRKEYYHHWSKSLDEIDEDALRCLRNMSRLASNHLELLENQVNINKIKSYHKNST